MSLQEAVVVVCCLEDSGIAHLKPGYVEITCNDVSQFSTWSAADYHEIIDMLAEADSRVKSGRMFKVRFEELQQTSGFKFNEHGIGMDMSLRPLVNPIQVGTWDWVHTLFQDGVLSTEVWAYIAMIAIVHSSSIVLGIGGRPLEYATM